MTTNPSDLTPQPIVSPLGPWYDNGTLVNCTAQDVTGYAFDHWTVDGTNLGQGVNPITIIMEEPHDATAYYNLTDIEPPTEPKDLVCISSVTDPYPSFSWTASTDNLAVKGYYVNITDYTPYYIGNVTVWTSPDEITDCNHTFNVWATDYANNNSTIASLNFTIDTTAPTVTILTPTTASPIYTQTPTTIYVSYNYTELHPKNATIKVHNATHTIGEATVTTLIAGANINRNDSVTTTAAADGIYNVTVTLYEKADKTGTDTEEDAVIITPPKCTTIIFLDPSDYIFAADAVSVGTRFNVTVKVQDVTDLAAFEVRIFYNDSIINVTRWYEPTWYPEYVFYGKGTLPVPDPVKVYYRHIGPGNGSALVGASLFPAPPTQTPFNGNGTLCILEFQITVVPLEGEKYSCDLGINNPETHLLNSEAEEIPYVMKENGYYEITVVLRPHGYLVVRGMNNKIYYSVWNGTAWSNWIALPGATVDTPAAEVFGNELHLVVRGVTGGLWHGYVNLTDSNFSGWTLLPGATPSAPTLTASATELYLVVRGLDNVTYYNVWNRTAWTGWTGLPGATIESPAAAVLGNNLHMVVIGTAGRLWHGYVNLTDSGFSGWSLLTGTTPSAPTLTASPVRLYLVVRGMNDRIYYRAWNGTSWESWIALPGATVDSPATTVLANNLHIVVRGMDGTSLWHGCVDLSTSSFSGWSLLTGATPSPPELAASQQHSMAMRSRRLPAIKRTRKENL